MREKRERGEKEERREENLCFGCPAFCSLQSAVWSSHQQRSPRILETSTCARISLLPVPGKCARVVRTGLGTAHAQRNRGRGQGWPLSRWMRASPLAGLGGFLGTLSPA